MNLHRKRFALVLPVLLSLLVGGAAVFPVAARAAAAEQVAEHAARGAIQSPPDSARVPRSFAVAGVISGSFRNLWLVVRIDNLYWPKEPKLAPADGRWAGRVNEGGSPPGGRFELLLIDVPEDSSATFEEWLNRGRRSNSYPGIRASDVRGAVILDRRSYLLSGS